MSNKYNMCDKNTELNAFDLFEGDKIETMGADLENKPDNINHPSHYQHGGIETIDVIKAWTDGLYGFEAVLAGNVIKYISRWKQKNGIEDLKKANWYLERLIEFEEE